MCQNLVFVALAAIALILPSVHPLQNIPKTVLQGDENSCSSDLEREAARQAITTDVRNLLKAGKSVPLCGNGIWRKVVSLNMSDPTQQCPSPWREYNTIRSCGRPVGAFSCVSVTFDTTGFQYTKVCGRAIGYQYYTTDCFYRFVPQSTGTPDDNYVDGISVTHGNNPRKHIWTFATGLLEPNEAVRPGHRKYVCPCAAPNDPRFGTDPPSYVGDNYFCEAGHTDTVHSNTHYSEPLWDGEGCANSQCCTFNTPPWFNVQLPSSTTDDIEVRICSDQVVTDEDTTIGELELYIQ